MENTSTKFRPGPGTRTDAPVRPESGRGFKVGDRVNVKGFETGIIKYIGAVHFKDGVWCGVELDRKVGKHGGSVDGRRYFSCPPGFGILVPVHKLTPGMQGSARLHRKNPPAGLKQQHQPTTGQKQQQQQPAVTRRQKTATTNTVSMRNRSLNPTAWRPSDLGVPISTELNKTFTLDSLNSINSPDIVTSCDLRSDLSDQRSETSQGSKRSSGDMEDSLGILSPGQMKEFSIDSMSQSLVSVSSLVKDLSWDDLNSQTHTDNRRCNPAVSSSSLSTTSITMLNKTFSIDKTKSKMNRTLDLDELELKLEHKDETRSKLNITMDLDEIELISTYKVKPMSRLNNSLDLDEKELPSTYTDKTRSRLNTTLDLDELELTSTYKGKTKNRLNTTLDLDELELTSTYMGKTKNRLNTTLDLDELEDMEKFEPFQGRVNNYGWKNESELKKNIGLPGRGTDWLRESEELRFDGFQGKRNDHQIRPSSNERSGSQERGRFCLDSSKLEEIEALGSSPIQSCFENRLDQTIEIYSTPSPLLDDSFESYHTPPESDFFSKILFQRTQSLLRSRTRSNKKKNRKESVTDSIYKSVEKSPKVSLESLDEGSNLVIQSLEEASDTILKHQNESSKRKLQPQEDSPNRFLQDSKKFAKSLVKPKIDSTCKNQEDSSEQGYECKEDLKDQEQIPQGNDEFYEMAFPKQKRSMATILQEGDDSLDQILQPLEESFELILQPQDQIPQDLEESSRLFLQPGETHKGECALTNKDLDACIGENVVPAKALKLGEHDISVFHNNPGNSLNEPTNLSDKENSASNLYITSDPLPWNQNISQTETANLYQPVRKCSEESDTAGLYGIESDINDVTATKPTSLYGIVEAVKSMEAVGFYSSSSIDIEHQGACNPHVNSDSTIHAVQCTPVLDQEKLYNCEFNSSNINVYSVLRNEKTTPGLNTDSECQATYTGYSTEGIIQDVCTVNEDVVIEPCQLKEDVELDPGPLNKEVSLEPGPLKEELALELGPPGRLQEDGALDPGPLNEYEALDPGPLKGDVAVAPGLLEKDLALVPGPLKKDVVLDSGKITKKVALNLRTPNEEVALELGPLKKEVAVNHGSLKDEVAVDPALLKEELAQEPGPLKEDVALGPCLVKGDLARGPCIVKEDVALEPGQVKEDDVKLKEDINIPLTPETRRRLRPFNRLLEKLQMSSDPLLDSTYSQGKNSLFDSQYSTGEIHSLVASVSLSTDMESSGFYSDIDGRISKNQEEKSLAGVELLPRDGKDDIHKVVIIEEGDFKIHGISPLSRQICRNEGSGVDTEEFRPVGPITREISLDRSSPDISGFSNQELSEVIYGVSNQEILEAVSGVFNQDISEVAEGKDPKKRPEQINNSKDGLRTGLKGLNQSDARQSNLRSERTDLGKVRVGALGAKGGGGGAVGAVGAKGVGGEPATSSSTMSTKRNTSEPVKARASKPAAKIRKPGKWDAIMDRIERSKQRDGKPTSDQTFKSPGSQSSRSNLSREESSMSSRTQDISSHIRTQDLSRTSSRTHDVSHGCRTQDLSPMSSRTQDLSSFGSNDSLHDRILLMEDTAGSLSGQDFSPRSSVTGSPKRKLGKLQNKENMEDRKRPVTADGPPPGRRQVFRTNSTSSQPPVRSNITKNENSVLSPKNMLSPSSEKSVFIKRLPPSSKQGSPCPGLADRTRSGSNTSTISRVSVSSRVSAESKRSVTSGRSTVTSAPQRKTTLTRTGPKVSTTNKPVQTNKPVPPPTTITTTVAGSKSRVAENNRKNSRVSKPSKDVHVSGDQPDLLKETVRKGTRKNSEATEAIKQAARWNAQGFSAMATVAEYFRQRTELREGDFKDVLCQLKRIKEESLKSLEEKEKDVKERMEMERKDWNAQMEKARLDQDALDSERVEEIKQLQLSLNVLIREKSELEASCTLGLVELETRLKESTAKEKADLESELRASGEKEKAELQQRLLDLSAQEKVDLEKRLSEKFEEEKVESVKKLREDWEAEKALIEKKTREEVLVERAERKSSKKDHRLEAEKERAGRLEQEVESLRTVLEMKTEELHASRLSRVKLEERIAEYEQKEEVWRKASAQVEDLKEQLLARNDIERRLQDENRSLSSLIERELNEKKRLSMENEQLSWKMKQDGESMSFSFCEGTDHSLPIIGNLRSSLRGRPVSAPPGKNGIPIRPFPEDSGDLPPHSPRVLEVVEKIESVAWKLEYDLPDISPRLSRKLSPQSPLFLRKCKSSSLMTRSLDRTNLLTRSNSSPGSSHSPLLGRSSSTRRKVSPPQFETLNEFTDESDESKKNSPDEPVDVEHEAVERTDMKQPNPVDIGLQDDELCEISSSSEIEVGDPDSLNIDSTDSEIFDPSLHSQQDSGQQSPRSEPQSPRSEPHSPVTETTLRAGMLRAEDSDTDLSEAETNFRRGGHNSGAVSRCSLNTPRNMKNTKMKTERNKNMNMNQSLPSYDLSRLFYEKKSRESAEDSESSLSDF